MGSESIMKTIVYNLMEDEELSMLAATALIGLLILQKPVLQVVKNLNVVDNVNGFIQNQKKASNKDNEQIGAHILAQLKQYDLIDKL